MRKIRNMFRGWIESGRDDQDARSLAWRIAGVIFLYRIAEEERSLLTDRERIDSIYAVEIEWRGRTFCAGVLRAGTAGS